MKNGYRVIDTDTHVGPNVETLREYASPTLRARWEELKPFELPVTEGHHWSINPRPFKRKMGEKGEEEKGEKGGKMPLKGKTTDYFKVPPQPEVNNMNAAGRLKDMDLEGRDVDLIIPATFATAVSAIDPELAVEAHAAYNRYIADYCSSDVNRLKATILVLGSDPEWAAREIKNHAQETHVAACTVVLPEGMPIDDPDLHPIWRALDENDLPILHHSFFYEPPYFPGYRDVCDNVVVARTAAHPWGAQRLLALPGPERPVRQVPEPARRLRRGRCGVAPVLDEAAALAVRVHARRGARPRARSGRVRADGTRFSGLELYEGSDILRGIVDVVGDGVAMYQSDFPHPQCNFPNSPDDALSWDWRTIGEGDKSKRRFFSENAEAYLRMI